MESLFTGFALTTSYNLGEFKEDFVLSRLDNSMKMKKLLLQE